MKLHRILKADVQQAITMREAIDVVKDASAQLSAAISCAMLRYLRQAITKYAQHLFKPHFLAHPVGLLLCYSLICSTTPLSC